MYSIEIYFATRKCRVFYTYIKCCVHWKEKCVTPLHIEHLLSLVGLGQVIEYSGPPVVAKVI